MPEARLCPECRTELPTDAPEELCPQCLLHVALSDSDHDLVEEGPGTEAYPNRFAAPSPAELAPLFPQLEIVELLGQGGMGAVYKARQTKLDRLVALKILPAEEGRDAAFAERFAREARALAKLNHPNIVAVHDFGEAAGLYYFIMEFVDGTNLRQVLQARQLDPSEALQIVPQICDALQYAHEEEIVHRDIKPENILLDKRGRVKIADFGLAKLLARSGSDFTLTGSRQVMGTLHYMAPEQIEKPHTVDHRADIYSLGVVFYEMLTGELPMGRFPLPSQKRPMDARLDDMVLRALAKEPEQRYQRISELKMDVATIVAACPRETPAEPAAAEVAKPRKPKEGIVGKVRSFFDSVRYYILDSAANQSSASQFTNSSSEKRRVQESPPCGDQPRRPKTDLQTQPSASKESPNGFLDTATGWEILFCLFGAGASLLPNSMIIPNHPLGWGQLPFTPGYQVECQFTTFLVVALLLTATYSIKPIPAWLPLIVILSGAAVAWFGLQVLVFPPEATRLVSELRRLPGVQHLDLAVISEARPEITIGPGLLITVALGIVLAFLGAAQYQGVLARRRSQE